MLFGMKDVVDPDLVVELYADTRDDVIREMMDVLAAKVPEVFGHRQSLVHQMLRREESGTTGAGRGVAVPHARDSCVGERIRMVVGRSLAPIEWRSLDLAPVRIVFCIVGPPHRPGDFLRTKLVVTQFFCKSSIERLYDVGDFKPAFLQMAYDFDRVA